MILYHYCSNQTFHSIISRSSLRLSSMTLSNDAEEGVWTIKMLREACEQLVDGSYEVGKFTHFHLQRAFDGLDGLWKTFDGLGLCFSSRGDMLSQWRGYADDGQGISIGFSAEHLHNWAGKEEQDGISLEEVIYKKEEALKQLLPVAQAIKSHALNGAFDNSVGTLLGNAGKTEQEILEQKEHVAQAVRQFGRQVIPNIVADLYRFKNPAFDEELEWRLLTYLKSENRASKLEIHPGRDVLKPFRTFTIAEKDKAMVSEIILGPKNRTPSSVVELFLREHNFRHATVKRSKSTYR